MDVFIFSLFCGLMAFVGVVASMPFVMFWLKEHNYLDIPNERSSHVEPRIIGGGWAVLPVILVAITALFCISELPLYYAILPISALFLMILSWQDDRAHVNPAIRFPLQAICVAATVYLLPADGYVFQGHLPFWLDRALTFWAFLWFVNLYNFMDGIDGITSVETAFIGVGVAVILILYGVTDYVFPAYGFIIGFAALAFLIWNWHPAKVFIGDVGAVPLGLLLGWYLFYLATQGFIWAACIIPLYYCFDTTITLARRIKQGHKPWEPHRFFFFQAPVPHAMNHAQVVLHVLGINVFLFICAYFAAVTLNFWEQLPAILASGFGVIALLTHFESKREGKEVKKKTEAKAKLSAKKVKT